MHSETHVLRLSKVRYPHLRCVAYQGMSPISKKPDYHLNRWSVNRAKLLPLPIQELLTMYL
jgi:hypothetical protein